jgi:hypothetical protein
MYLSDDLVRPVRTDRLHAVSKASSVPGHLPLLTKPSKRGDRESFARNNVQLIRLALTIAVLYTTHTSTASTCWDRRTPTWCRT